MLPHVKGGLGLRHEEWASFDAPPGKPSRLHVRCDPPHPVEIFQRPSLFLDDQRDGGEIGRQQEFLELMETFQKDLSLRRNSSCRCNAAAKVFQGAPR